MRLACKKQWPCLARPGNTQPVLAQDQRAPSPQKPPCWTPERAEDTGGRAQRGALATGWALCRCWRLATLFLQRPEHALLCSQAEGAECGTTPGKSVESLGALHGAGTGGARRSLPHAANPAAYRALCVCCWPPRLPGSVCAAGAEQQRHALRVRGAPNAGERAACCCSRLITLLGPKSQAGCRSSQLSTLLWTRP